MSLDVLLECPRTSFRDVLRVNVTERVWIFPGGRGGGGVRISSKNDDVKYEQPLSQASRKILEKGGNILEEGNCCKRNRQNTRDGRGRWTGFEGSVRVPCGP